jgi:hypothetical protein
VYPTTESQIVRFAVYEASRDENGHPDEAPNILYLAEETGFTEAKVIELVKLEIAAGNLAESDFPDEDLRSHSYVICTVGQMEAYRAVMGRVN